MLEGDTVLHSAGHDVHMQVISGAESHVQNILITIIIQSWSKCTQTHMISTCFDVNT